MNHPGFFGWEEKFKGWDDPNQCSPQRRQACIDNTKSMHEAVRSILIGASAP